MSQIKIAFIKQGEGFSPSHLSEVKVNDIYYLVVDGKPGEYFKASQDAFLDSQENWVISGTPIE